MHAARSLKASSKNLSSSESPARLYLFRRISKLASPDEPFDKVGPVFKRDVIVEVVSGEHVIEFIERRLREKHPPVSQSVAKGPSGLTLFKQGSADERIRVEDVARVIFHSGYFPTSLA